MRMNTLKPAQGSKTAPKRLGRGIGSGLGKTSGRGHKGQKARAGGYHKVGFEGGQMPLQRRLPKFGFFSLKDKPATVRLYQLNKIKETEINLDTLKEYGIVPKTAKQAKIIVRGNLTQSIKIKGLGLSAGARSAIEAVGGIIEN